MSQNGIAGRKQSFEGLVDQTRYVHEASSTRAKSAVNQMLTAQNWAIWYYIVNMNNTEKSGLSPAVANFTLDGLQKAIYSGIYGRTNDIDYANGAMVRYADDVIVAVRSVDEANAVLFAIQKFLEPRGLILSEEKSKIGNRCLNRQCAKHKVMLPFAEIERILGFELSEPVKINRTQWYSRKGMHMMADAWNMQGYKLKRLYVGKQKALFEAQFEDAEHVFIPPEILDRKTPANAKHEIEHFLQSIVKKYALANDDILPHGKEQASGQST